MHEEKLDLQSGRKLYFASDFHLGISGKCSSVEREKKIVKWLEQISKDAQAIFLVGDLFDFWYEYRHVVPKGHVRFLGKLAELADRGIQIIIFTGNHDLWMKDYFEDEINACLYKAPVRFLIDDKAFWIGHGDGLDPKVVKYRIIKWVFTQPFFQWLYGWVHPSIAFVLANFWSGKSRSSGSSNDENDAMINFCKKSQSHKSHDYYIMGDCHSPMVKEINPESKYVNLGDWLNHFSFAEYDGSELKLDYFES